MNDSHPGRRVVVIGGGISGLAAAQRLVEIDPTVQLTLVEASDRLGGVVHSVWQDGYLIEESADNFLVTEDAVLDLCRRLGLGDEIITTTPSERRALVVHRGRLEPVPPGFALMAPARAWPLVTTRLLSPWGKLRLALEPLIPARRNLEDESLADFARRRLGREGFERLVQPLVSGIYTADPERLSMAAALPRFWEMEAKHGSLYRGVRRQTSAQRGEATSGARYNLFVTLRNGLSTLVEALSSRLGAERIRLNSPVQGVQRRDDQRWEVTLATSGETLTCGAVIVAVGAPRAAGLLAGVDAELAALLAAIEYAGCVIAAVGFAESQFSQPLDGFGFVVPACEGRRILACSYSSRKFPGRAPDGHVLLRVFVGGACQPELTQLDDAQLAKLVCDELSELLGIAGKPAMCRIIRWTAAMPQYHVGHLARVAEISRRAEALRGLALAGNAYHGVGIPQCIQSGEQAAERIALTIQNTSTG